MLSANVGMEWKNIKATKAPLKEEDEFELAKAGERSQKAEH
jgi:hypothetical protein